MSITELLGVELPIIQAPMAGVQGSALALAVAEAGGLGSLPCAMLSRDVLLSELKLLGKSTDKPINLNFFCHAPPHRNFEQNERWHTKLTPYFEEFGASVVDVPSGSSRQPFSHELADIIEPFQPKIISFHFGLPEKELLERVKGWGATVLSSATTVAEAQWLERHGADAIIAQGLEAGGHRGMFLSKNLENQLGTFALLPQIVDSVSVPVIAAGGIVDSRGVQAAVSLGASAVQVGTAYLLCPEAATSELHRAALKSTAGRETAVTNIFSGRPARGIVNRAIVELGAIARDAPEFPLASNAMGVLRSHAEAQGLSDFSPLWCGENATGCRELAAAQVTRELVGAL